MVDIVTLGYNVDTSQVLKGDKALDDLTSSTLSADVASKKLTTSTLSMGRNVANAAVQANNLNRATLASSNGLRQTSLQLSQVVQQAQAGGGVLRALAIQLPDIGLAFGTIGIAAGIAGGTILSVASGFLNARGGADDLEKALDQLGQTSDQLDQSLRLARLSGDDLAETYGVAATRVREFALAQAQLRADQAEAQLRDQVNILGDLAFAYTDILDRGGAFRTQVLNKITQDFGISGAAAEKLQGQLQNLARTEEFEAQQEILQGIIRTLDEADVPLSEIPRDLQIAVDQMINLSNETDRTKELMRQLAAESAQVNVSGIGAVPQVGDSNLLPPQDLNDTEARTGGGRADPYENNLNRLVESLQSERETLEIWYAESEILLNDHRARKLLGEEEHKAALLALDEEYAARQAALADQTAQYEISAKQRATSAITGLLSSLAGDSRAAAIALIAISKGQAIAQAIQNTAVAQVRALAELGPIAGPPAAAKIAAFGKVQIAAIAATGLTQAASAGGSAASGSESTSEGESVSATSGTEVAQPRRIILDFQGQNDLGAFIMESITANIQEESDLGVIFEVAR